MASLLLVDADKNFRRSLEIALRLDGAQVWTAGTANEALLLLDLRTVELVAVDSVLAGVDALLARAAAMGVECVVTGTWPELLARAARRHGVPVLEKPFTAEQLLAAGAPRATRALP